MRWTAKISITPSWAAICVTSCTLQTVRRLSLGAGESLVLYSDGITEAQDPAGDDYQEERLIRSLRDRFEQGADAMADGVLRDVARFRQTRPPVDDMTLLIVRRRG